MEENKETCNHGCGKKNSTSERKVYGPAFGEAVASMAIDAMNEEEEPKEAAAAFIGKCVSEGRNPIEVVKRVAGHYKISVSSEEPPENDALRHVYFLLREVVRQVVTSAAEEQNEEDGQKIEKFVRNVFKYSFSW